MINLNHTATRQTKALHAALDAAAPDQESWLAGEATFNEARSNNESIEDALSFALDNSAPDQEPWVAGRKAFYELLNDDQNKTERRNVFSFSPGAFSPKQQAALQPHPERN